MDLMPASIQPLKIDPAIPEDFVASSPSGELNLNDWVYWGPKDALDQYFKNPESLNRSFLRFKLSSNVAQIGPEKFSDEESLKTMEAQNPKAFSSILTKWGEYPVRAVKTEIQGQPVTIAWVGLNDYGSGWTLMFNLVYPYKSGRPNKEDLRLWDDFISKTKGLKDEEILKAQGQDLQEGFTQIDTSGLRLKMIAEKRKRDGMLQIVVEPENPNFQIKLIAMEEEPVVQGSKPLVKVLSIFDNKELSAESSVMQMTSIQYKLVDEFSEKKEKDTDLIFQKQVQ